MTERNERLMADTLDDAGKLSTIFEDLEARSQSFGSALTRALKGAVVDGKGLDDVLKGLALRMSDIALSAGLKPLENLLSSTVGNLFNGLSGGAKPFAKGGVVASPTYFGIGGGSGGGGLGLMGETGAEAILPLARGPDGSLGVAAGGGGGANIVFNVTATDAASFRKSEGQIAAMLTRAVGRGQRGL